MVVYYSPFITPNVAAVVVYYSPFITPNDAAVVVYYSPFKRPDERPPTERDGVNFAPCCNVDDFSGGDIRLPVWAHVVKES